VAVRQRARAPPRALEEAAQVAIGRAGRHHEHVRRLRQRADVGEVPHRIEGHLPQVCGLMEAALVLMMTKV
jgi:hypothetical protein